MFGMGFLEILLILIVAVIALGPEKLPTAAVDIAKMIKKLKTNIDDVKTTVTDELSINEVKTHAQEFKDSMGIDRIASLNLDDIVTIDEKKEDSKPKKNKNKNKDV